MAKPDQFSDSEIEDSSKITDPASCLDYLKRREVFLYKMMNDPSHKAMLYFLEVLMNSDSPLLVEQLAARFINKAFSDEMREACGGGSVEALREFLLKYPSLFTVKPNDLVSAVAIDMPGFDEMSEGSMDVNIVSSKPASSSRDAGNQRPSSGSSGKSENNHTSAPPQPLKSSLKSSNATEVKPVGIYQPPVLRAQAAAAAAVMTRKPPFCEMCSMAAHMATTAATTVVHCPFAGLHHCNHHQNPRHSQPTLKHIQTTSHCCCGESTPSTSYYRSPGTPKVPACAYTDNFALETEAVKFFQQRLCRREERWIPIKSLAGHLSQASTEVRSIVGPQLEFRRFLLKHPHVFEVQGDLVGLKNPFTAACLSSSSSALGNRPKSFVGSILNSQSSASLSALNPRAGGSQKFSRPKSLIMLTQASVPSGPIRRLESIQTGSENFLAGGCDLDSFAISSPKPTPTQQNRSSGSRPKANGTNRNSAAQQDTVTSSVRQPLRGNRCQEVDMTSSTGSICIKMSANEYRAIMFLRKVLAKKGGAPGQLGLSYVQLMRILSAKAPETVQSAIGWTKVELEEFILQHPIFFEIHDCSDVVEQQSLPVSSVTWALGDSKEKPSTLVTNRRVLKMINIVITGNKPLDSGTRTMTNRSGRVFHVAKLWGIIDLGKHEHVFFDKSILKYVDDLQKHFKVDEMLYFNAILAPKESRAKWRATQVWKECDKEIMEKFGGAAFTSRTCGRSATGVASSTGAQNSAGKAGDSDSSDYGLVDEEEVEEDIGAASAIARAEGLNLANDIKFLSDEVEEELERLLGPNKAVATTSTTTTNFDTNNRTGGKSALGYASDEDTSITGCIEEISVDFSDLGSLSENDAVRATSRPQKTQNKSAPDSSMSDRPSIAVQTLSTGDIMATQIFHDIG